MIELFMSPTPNGQKIVLFLQETCIVHTIRRMSLSGGDQHKPDFLAISPNAKIPAIVDHAPADGGAPLAMFESGAILLYLAEKHGVLLPRDRRAKLDAIQWLFWQVGGLGPFAGQAGFFNVYATERVPFAIARYERELARLYSVLDRRLAEREFIAGDEYSIADISAYPWIVPHAPHGQDLARFPNIQRWFAAITARPATQRAYDGVEDVYGAPAPLSAEQRQNLYGAA